VAQQKKKVANKKPRSRKSAGPKIIAGDASKSKRVGETRLGSEEWHRALLDTAGKGGMGIEVVQNAPEGEATIIFVNDALCDMLGYSREEMLGMSKWKIIAPQAVSMVQDIYRRSQRGEEAPGFYETTMLCKDGTLLPVEATVINMTYQGRMSIVSHIRDVTKQKQVEEAQREARNELEKRVAERTAELARANEALLLEIGERKRIEEILRGSEQKFRLMFESVADGITVTDLNGTIVELNEATVKLHGYSSKEEMIGLSAFVLIADREHVRAAENLRRTLIEGQVRDVEYKFLTKDGKEFDAELSASVLRDSAGAPVAFIAIVRDITERKRMREALEGSEKYFRSLIENALDAIAVVDANGTLIYESPAFERMLGYKFEDRIGKSSLELVHADDMPKVTMGIAALIQRPGVTQHIEVRAQHKDGSWRNLEIVGRNLLDDPVVHGVVANFRDITERKQAEIKLEELYRQEKELRQKLEMEMKKRVEFTRALAHEIKTPLTPMLISSQVLASELKDEQLLRLARNISRGASNLNSRIDELLDMARGEMGMLRIKPEKFAPLLLLHEVVDYVAPVAANREQAITVELPDSLPEVNADKVRVRQILLNLLNNAFKFTPEGGEIVLRAGVKESNIVIEVEDNGPGIEEDMQERIFEPYHRMQSDGEHLSGLGLGLALCRTLVELHGGQIWVRSKVGRGSTFGLSLPLEGSGDIEEV
jgi:PAS domain S-box-containing protein